MVGPGGLEPPTPALSTRCSNQLSYEPKFKKEFNWWSRSGSNRRPPECKSGALPTELRPRMFKFIKSQSSVQWYKKEAKNKNTCPSKTILCDQ